MKEIDWGKAPEGATHWGPDTDRHCESWYEVMGGEVVRYLPVYYSPQPMLPAVNGSQYYHPVDDLVARPAPWVGAGLPPVGTVCEMWHEKIGDWLKSEVAFVGEQILVVRYHSIAHGHHEAAIMNLDSEKLLRLPRTPEQIAAEERERAIDDLCASIVSHYEAPKMSERYLGLARALHDAGFRRQEPSE